MATDPNTARHYNENAENYDRHVSDATDSVFHSHYEKPAIRAELPELAGLDVISIGCGSGHDANWLLQNGAQHVTGVDISEGLIEIGASKFPDVDFHIMDMENLDFPDERFDLAYSSLAIHYVDDWTQPLTEAYRILKPGSMYVFSCGHPIDSAMQFDEEDGYKYARLGRKVDVGNETRTIYGDYLAKDGNGTKPVRGLIGDMEVVIFHRTLAVMIQQILESGFKIEKVVEPLPTHGMNEDAPRHFEELNRIPTFMIWVLRKE